MGDFKRHERDMEEKLKIVHYPVRLEQFNKVYICGRITKTFEFDHELNGYKLFSANVTFKRNAKAEDSVTVIANEDVKKCLKKDSHVKIIGHLRTSTLDGDDKKHIRIYVYATEIYETDEFSKEESLVFFEGYLHKPPYFKMINQNQVTIAKAFFIVERKWGKGDYIPCLFLNKYSEKAKNFNVGDRIRLYGRIQSRKHKSFNQYIEEEFYEVFVDAFKMV